ncbi:MAG: MCE family protein [Aquihabitans sp.]
MPIRALRLLAAVTLVGVLGLTSCTDRSGGGRIEASATFDDVADLADGAPVMMADVTIGSVRSIELDATGRRARVVFGVDESANVPAAVTAQIRRTSALGEKFIDLVPETDDLKAEPLTDGAVIDQTAVVSDLEQLISSGTDAFGALSASQIAILLDEGERAFAGKAPQLRTILDHLSEVAAGYETRTEKVKAIIVDLDRLAGDLAPQTGENGEALANLKDTLKILNENDEAFYALVRSLNEVADDGNRILDRHLDDIATQVRGLRDVTDAVADEQAALAGLLENLPRHNTTVPLAERNNFIHVLIDVVLCGVPGGGDVPGDPVDACEPGAGS